MAKEYYCYPREGFVPEVCTHEGLSLAHAQGTPFWLSEKGDVFIRYANRRWHRRIVDTCARKSYNTRTPNGVIRGRIYPGVTYKGVHYRVHILMALAWIGSIPAGWQVDHINGDINNWTRDNIRIVTVAENYRCGAILRWLRKKSIDTCTLTGMQCRVAFAVVPMLGIERRNAIQKAEIMEIISKYEIGDPAERMEYEMTHHMEV